MSVHDQPPDPRDRAAEEFADLGLAREGDGLDDTMSALRANPELAANVARIDVEHQLRAWFAPEGDGWTATRSLVTGRDEPAVEWTYAGRHPAPDGMRRFTSFNGIPPTGRAVTVAGITIIEVVTDDAGGRRLGFRRYVDWAAVFAQLGLTLNWRVPVPAP